MKHELNDGVTNVSRLSERYLAEAIVWAATNRVNTTREGIPLELGIRTMVSQAIPRRTTPNEPTPDDPFLLDSSYFSQHLDLAFALELMELLAEADGKAPGRAEDYLTKMRFTESAISLFDAYLVLFETQTTEVFVGTPQMSKALEMVHSALLRLVASLRRIQNDDTVTQGFTPLFAAAVFLPQTPLRKELAAQGNSDLGSTGVAENLRELRAAITELHVENEITGERILAELAPPKQRGSFDSKTVEQNIKTLNKAGALAVTILKLTGHREQGSKVGKLVHLSTGIMKGFLGIAAGKSRGNPIEMLGGALDIVGTVTGLFVKEGPSIEKQMLDAIAILYKQLDQITQHLDKRLDHLELLMSQVHRNVLAGIRGLSDDVKQVQKIAVTIGKDVKLLRNELGDGLRELKREQYQSERMTALRYSQDHGYPTTFPDALREQRLREGFETLRNWALTAPQSRVLTPQLRKNYTKAHLLEDLEKFGPEYCASLLQQYASLEFDLANSLLPIDVNIVIWAEAVQGFVENWYRNPDVTYKHPQLRVLDDLLATGQTFDTAVQSMRSSTPLFKTLIDDVKKEWSLARKHRLREMTRGFKGPSPRHLRLCRGIHQAIFGSYGEGMEQGTPGVPSFANFNLPPRLQTYMTKFGEKKLSGSATEMIANLQKGSKDSDACAATLRECGLPELFEVLNGARSHIEYFGRNMQKNHSLLQFQDEMGRLLPGYLKESSYRPPLSQELFANRQHMVILEDYFTQYMNAETTEEREQLRKDTPNLYFFASFAALPLVLYTWEPALSFVAALHNDDEQLQFEYTGSEPLLQSVKLAKAYFELTYAHELAKDETLRSQILGNLASIAFPFPSTAAKRLFRKFLTHPEDYPSNHQQQLMGEILDETFLESVGQLESAMQKLIQSQSVDSSRHSHPMVRAVVDSVNVLKQQFH